MAKSLISGLQDALKEKREKVARCEAALADARADVESYVAKISEALGIRLARKPGLKGPKGPMDPRSRAAPEPGGGGEAGDPSASAPRSTTRSDEVLRLFLAGESRSEIADALKITVQNVYQTISHLRKNGRLPPAGDPAPSAMDGVPADPETEDPAAADPAAGSSGDEESSGAGGGPLRGGPLRGEPPGGGPLENGDGDGDGDSLADLRAEVARQQAGARSAPVRLVTCRVNGHAHDVVVDRMGDGSTRPDSTGHGHRFYRFVSSQSNKHGHGLLVPSDLGGAA
jgi:hypothetical protein